ncbi:MAG: hypothetical protein OEM82_08850 [Acidobacteriota bacterium]|nr:hypothetical protein [Acidobacteriota bacterium]MDH3528798.1 hypothetical protein [Acidobacteriota bacterium]
MNSDFEDFEQDLEELNRQLDDGATDDDTIEDLTDFPVEEMIEFNLDDIKTRTAVLSKNDMIALLCLKTADKGGAICRVDPREANPAVQVYDDAENALDWYTKSLQTSRKNGWLVVYDGLPLEG